MLQRESEIIATIGAALGDYPREIRFDNRPHRFRIAHSPDAGWYIAHSFDAVTFGDWRDPAATQTWFAKAEHAPATLPTAEQIALDARRAAERAAAELETARCAAEAAKTAAAIWAAAPAAPVDHPYLERKRITPHIARVLTPAAAATAPPFIQQWIASKELVGSLIIPAGCLGEIASLQFIRADRKLLLPRGTVRGNRCILGRTAEAETIVVAEGFATAASLHEATGYPVVVAFDAGNLSTVAAGIRREHPSARIVLGADNDVRRPDETCQTNTGLVAAQQAALRVGGTVALAVLDRGETKADWNDVAVALGNEETARLFRATLELPTADLAPPELPTAAVAAADLRDALHRFLDRAGTPEQRDMAIRAAAGLGKSTQALKAIHERGLRADYFVPSFALAKEQADRLPPMAACAIRGRTHQTPDTPPLCAKHEAATALQKAGMGHMTALLLCGKVDPETGKRPCPYAAGCGYLKQFNDPAPIRFYAHEWLPLPERDKRTPQVAVIDESFRDALERHRAWDVADLFAAGPLYRALAGAVADGNLIEVATAQLAAMDAELDTAPATPPNIHPEMSASEVLAKLSSLDDVSSERRRLSFLRAVKRAVAGNAPLSLWHVAHGQGAGKIHAAWTAPMNFIASDVPRLFLDASLSPRLVNKVSPGMELLDIAARRNARVVQVVDTALSKHRLGEDNDHLSARIVEFATRRVVENPNGALIAPKDWLATHGSRLPCCVKQAHYGALRGLNELESADWLIVVGRNEPPPWAVESVARAWFAGAMEPGTVTREQAPLRARNGDTATITRTAFTDPRCQEILESIREQESLQAVDRLRLIHASAPKTIYLLSNLPLPGLPPDELVRLDDLMLPGRLAEVMLRDSVLVGPAALAGRHPDLFPTAKAAEREYRTFAAGANTAIPYKYSIRETRGLMSIIYRSQGTSGKPRRALVYGSTPTDFAAALLNDIHGAEITILERKALIQPPAALPARAAVPTMPDPAREDSPLPAPPARDPLPAPERPARIPSEPFRLPTMPATPAPPAISSFAMPPHLASLYAALDASRAALETA